MQKTTTTTKNPHKKNNKLRRYEILTAQNGLKFPKISNTQLSLDLHFNRVGVVQNSPPKSLSKAQAFEYFTAIV